MGGFNPWCPDRFTLYNRAMKIHHPKKSLTFGEYVVSVYKTCGNRRAQENIQFAVNAHLVHFLGRNSFVISNVVDKGGARLDEA